MKLSNWNEKFYSTALSKHCKFNFVNKYVDEQLFFEMPLTYEDKLKLTWSVR